MYLLEDLFHAGVISLHVKNVNQFAIQMYCSGFCNLKFRSPKFLFISMFDKKFNMGMNLADDIFDSANNISYYSILYQIVHK